MIGIHVMVPGFEIQKLAGKLVVDKMMIINGTHHHLETSTIHKERLNRGKTLPVKKV